MGGLQSEGATAFSVTSGAARTPRGRLDNPFFHI